MIRSPSDGDGIVCIVGIDPGTSKPGLCLLYYDVVSKKIVKVFPIVMHLDRFIKAHPQYGVQSERSLRIRVFRDYLKTVFLKVRPFKVASEHPYINIRRPSAVIPLAECLAAIEDEVFNYDPYLVLEKIDPSSIKKSVGVKGDSGDKHAMTLAIKKIPEIMDVLKGNIDTLDNNAVDSIAVSYCSLQRELSEVVF